MEILVQTRAAQLRHAYQQLPRGPSRRDIPLRLGNILSSKLVHLVHGKLASDQPNPTTPWYGNETHLDLPSFDNLQHLIRIPSKVLWSIDKRRQSRSRDLQTLRHELKRCKSRYRALSTPSVHAPKPESRWDVPRRYRTSRSSPKT